MKIEILLSTMKNNLSLIARANIQTDCVVVNQCDTDNIITIKENNVSIKWINSKSKGLSISRNLAIKNSTNEICVICDDDVIYVDGYEKLIVNEFRKREDVDVIAFNVEIKGGGFLGYTEKEKRVNFINSMKLSSVQLAFRRDKIIKNNLMFMEEFGSGAKYKTGEENIFLIHCLRKKLKIAWVPVKIANLTIGESSWFDGFNSKYFYSQGAVFSAMTKRLSLLLIFLYALRKYYLYRHEANIMQAIKWMLVGRKEYLCTEKNI